MSNLTTRKIVLGMLMTLVLTVGVLGSADALTFGNHTTSDGDLRTLFQNQNFTIRVPVTPKSPERKTSHKDYKQIPAASVSPATVLDKKNKTAYYEDDYDTSVSPPTGTSGYNDETQVTYDDAHNYDQEFITISVTGNADIKKVGSYNVPRTLATTLPMYESTHNLYDGVENYQRLSGSLTLTLEPTGLGPVVISILDSTDQADRKGAPSQPIAFTVYVVDYSSTAAASVGWTGLTDNYHIGRNDSHDSPIRISVVPATNTPITLEVVEGSGRLYVQKSYATPAGAPMSKSSPVRKLETSSDAATSTNGVVYLDMGGTTNRVTVKAPGLDFVTAIFVYGFPSMDIVSGDNQPGAIGGRLEDPLVVKVKDGKERGVPMAIVTFSSGNTTDTNERLLPVPGTTVHLSATPVPPDWAESYNDIADINKPVTATATYPMTDDSSHPGDTDDNVVVQTDRSGEAQVYFQLGATVRSQNVTATFSAGARATFLTTATDDRAAKLEIASGDNQRATKGDSLDDLLVVRASDLSGYRIPHIIIQFRSITGTFTRTAAYSPWVDLAGRPTAQGGTAALDVGELPLSTPNPNSGQQVYVKTNAHGEAAITYNIGQSEIPREVIAEVRQETVATATARYNFTIDRVTFNINGRTGPADAPAPAPAPAPRIVQVVVPPAEPRLIIEPASIVGTPSSEHEITIRAEDEHGVAVSVPSIAVGNLAFEQAGGSFNPGRTITPITGTLVLPNTPQRYEISAAAKDYKTAITSVRVAKGTLEITVPIQGAPGKSDTLRVTATDPVGDHPEDLAITLSVTTGGGTFASTTLTTNPSGYVTTTFTRGSAPGQDYFISATATGYTDERVRIQISGTPVLSTPTPTPTVSEPSSIEIGGQATRSGTVNEALEAPLLARVLDDDDAGIEDARVIFRVRKGQGRLSQRGNGRAVAVQTDSQGYARTDFTPMSAGTITVEASVRGVRETVTFTITTGSAPPTGTRGTDTMPGTVSPVVHVGAAKRPPMLWVDGGKIYALVGAKEQRFAPSVDNALNIAVGGGKVYWTEKTGESGGTINSANLDGTDVTELASIFATPMGIAVDVTNSKLYWTNSAGRIQSANLDGSAITNVIPGGLETPMDIALAGGNAYWTQGGNVRFVNLRGTKQIRNISTGTDAAGSLAIGGGKVYWTEMTGESGGTVNSANLNGTGATQLASILAAPMGIAVDGSRSKLYWTNSRGRVQSANLDGSGITNVVSGLGSPGDMVLSNSITETPAATTTTTTTTTASNKYDVNGDGSVNNADSDAVTVAIAAGATDAKYDVNGDGTVNVFDLVEIIANRDPGAAGAPTLFGMKLSAVQIDSIQEQIDLLIATNDRSPAAMRTLIYLQQLLVTARPEKTQLLANYPNPFNPETWIPYELATDTHVRLTIYNTQGVVIRTLQFGHQSAGYYTGRDRAAYWDGRNALGEQVASGLYFYQLETDEMSLMRKMVILK